MALTKKIMGAVAAIALVLTTVLTFAFKAGDNDKSIIKDDGRTFATSYHYKITSTDINDLRNLSNWEADVTTSPECGGGVELPCIISYTPTGSDPTFQAFLNNRDLPALLASTPSKKSD